MTVRIDRLQRMHRDLDSTELLIRQLADRPVTHEAGHPLADEANRVLAAELRAVAETAHGYLEQVQMRLVDEIEGAA